MRAANQNRLVTGQNSLYKCTSLMTQLSNEQTFELAVEHHRAGRLGEAEQLYKQVLAAEPDHVDAVHFRHGGTSGRPY